ncbi:MAG: hypothetical protein RLN86_12090, partial [Cyclobacteriaceae bacterium]
MDELHDEHLRKAFSKLREYESPQSGVQWRDLRMQLGGTSSWSKTAILGLILIVAISPIDRMLQNLHEENTSSEVTDQALRAVDLTNPSDLTTQQSTPNRIDKSDAVMVSKRDQVEEAIPNVKIVAPSIQSIGMNDQVPPPLTTLGAPDMENEDLIEGPAVEDLEFENVDVALASDSVTPYSDEKGELSRKFNLSIAPFYSFGIVDPITTDNLALDNYRSHPGYGIKVDLTFAMWSRPAGILELGTAYMFMMKKFEFDVLDYGSESLTSSSYKQNISAHYLGLTAQYKFLKRKWYLGTTWYQSLDSNNELNKFMGSGLLFVHAAKELYLIKPEMQVFVKASAGFPV